MNILLVSSYLPHPLDSGGHVRLYNIIKQLSKKHTITLVCEMRSNQTKKDVEELKRYCEKVITVPRRKQWTLTNIAKTGTSLNPFLIAGHTHAGMKEAIRQEVSTGKYHLIHVETFYVLQNVPETVLPIVLVEHNIEWNVYARFATQAPAFMRPILALDVKKLQRAERKAWERARAVVAVSSEEQAQMDRENVFVVPNGVDTKTFRKANPPKEKRILFIGNFSWIQNRDSVEWIVKDIWPKVSTKIDAKLWIVGRNMPEWLANVSDETINVDRDNTQETAAIFTDATMLLAPIRVGAGTQYKILEAMASGRPVITTQIGAEGLGAADEKDILIAETAADIARLVEKVLGNDTLYEKLAANGRKLVEANFTWEAITQKLEKVYEFVTDPGKVQLKSL